MLKFAILFSLVTYVWGFNGLQIMEMLPALIKSKNLKGNTKCTNQINTVKNEFLNGSEWALKMVDASAKPQSGFLKGNLVNFGDFDECLAVKSEAHGIRGQYCLARILFSDLEKNAGNIGKHYSANKPLLKGEAANLAALVFGLCIPDSCSAEEASNLTNNMMIFAEEVCQSANDYPIMTMADYCAIAFFVVISGLIVASTIYDCYFEHNKQSANKLLLAFSFWTNGRNLFKNSEKTDFSFVCGIRGITVMWVCLGHMSSYLNVWGVMNVVDLFEFLSNDKSMILLGASVAVDTNLVLTGMLVTYACLKKPSGTLGTYYLTRYLRLTPSFAVMVLLYVSLYKFGLSGPLGPVINKAFVGSCQDYWWSSLLHVQNWFNGDNICVTWYLSVDAQLYALAPLLLLPIRKYPKQILLATGILMCTSICVSFYVSWVYKLHSILNTFSDTRAPYTNQYYYQPYTRASPWLIGIILGYFIYKGKSVQHTNIKMNRFLVLFLWMISLTTMYFCIHGAHPLLLQEEYDRFLNCSFIAFSRPIWALAVSWVVYSCAMGYGGPVTWFLSLHIFEVLSKLSYSIFLLHTPLFAILLVNRRSSIKFSVVSLIYDFWAHFFVITALSVIWYLAFERPSIEIGYYFLRKSDGKAKTVLGSAPKGLKSE